MEGVGRGEEVRAATRVAARAASLVERAAEETAAKAVVARLAVRAAVARKPTRSLRCCTGCPRIRLRLGLMTASFPR